MIKSPVVTIKLLDEVHATVLNLTASQIKYLKKKFSFRPPNYRHVPAFKMKKWDGFISFFDINGNTYVNFVPEIYKILKKDLGITKVSLKDARMAHGDLTVEEIDADYFSEYGWTFEEHQTGAVNSIIRNGGGLIKAATGAGKTAMIAALADVYHKTLGFKTIVLVPTTDLCTQTRDEMCMLGLDVGRFDGDTKETGLTHLVSTWQSAMNSKYIFTAHQVVIVDECHTAEGPELLKMLRVNARNYPIRIGLTGTVPKDKCSYMTIRSVLGEIQYEVTTAELIDKGWLARVKIDQYILQESLLERYEAFKRAHPELIEKITYKKFFTTYFTDYDTELEYLFRNPDRLEFISHFVDAQLKTSEKRNALILVPRVEMGKRLAKMLPNAVFINGSDNRAVRQSVYGSFANNDDVIMVSTYHFASTGLNIKRIYHLFLVDAGKSYKKVIQSIGRGVRKADDKDSVTMYDISSNTTHSTRHRNKRAAMYREEGYTFKKIKLDYTTLFFDVDSAQDM